MSKFKVGDLIIRNSDGIGKGEKVTSVNEVS